MQIVAFKLQEEILEANQRAPKTNEPQQNCWLDTILTDEKNKKMKDEEEIKIEALEREL